ncbi:MAG: sulfur transferase domain-containing protein [Planctomycetota bacterium]
MQRRRHSLHALALVGLATLGSLACSSARDAGGAEVHAAFSAPPIAPPLVLASSAYEAAAAVELPVVAAAEYPGLHNVFQLSERIISGSEPHGEEGLAEVAKLGVKTILSVDGKAPDAETAAKYGMRYVHVPIQYKGITDEEVAKIAKTFRETEGPFYVHCFHGQHRGPAAAAIGRVAVDGLERDRAIAEMRQWCATSSKYEGLYAAVATKEIPTAAETARFAFDFEPAHTFEGKREAMIAMARHWDNVKLIQKAGWKVDPKHPDLDPLQEATQVHLLYEVCTKLPETFTYPDDYRTEMTSGFQASAELVRFLSDCTTTDVTPEQLADGLEAAFKAVGKSCSNCHKVYRD